MRAIAAPRLPGVYFLPPSRPAGIGLPPLDVAAFVGFAERGPLHLPVPVEDFKAYQDVFGGDWPLAWEPGGQTVYANLPQAVAGFFANGGRRCYVVRVAGEDATATRFPIPGMVALGEREEPKLASLTASSPGHWSERLRLGTRLAITPLPTVAFGFSDPHRLVWMTGSAPQAIFPGDVLRLTFEDGSQWLFPVVDVQRPPNATPVTPLILVAESTWQLTCTPGISPPLVVESTRRLTLHAEEPIVGFGDLSLTEDGRPALELLANDVDKIEPGQILRLELGENITYLFPVTELRLLSAIASPLTTPVVLAVADCLLRLPAQPLPTEPSRFQRVERLRFDLLLWEGEQHRPILNELAFNPGQPRFWGEVALLESSAPYRRSSADADGTRAARAARLFRELQGEVRSEEARNDDLDVAALAGLLAPLEEEEKAYTYLPLGMASVVTEGTLSGPGEVGSDDLGRFDPRMFLDDYLVPDPLHGAMIESSRTLMAAAFDRYYLQNRRLHGLHSLLFVNEVALIAVPDAVHRGWPSDITEPPPRPIPPFTLPLWVLPDWSLFRDCRPILPVEPQPAVQLPRTTEPKLPLLRRLEEFDSGPLLTLHQALITVCQARSDLVAILALPRHFEKRDCIGWQEDLRQRLGLPRRRSVFNDVRDIADLSYAAVYHPWLLVTDTGAPDRLRAVPCDGAVCGMTAARERQRQVWVAPANLPLQGVLGLTPEFSTDDWAELFALQFNLVRPEPRDFRAMSAHTLSDERAWLQVSVRRLMILLRKVAVERGMDFVFESNHERFREGVRAMLEDLLRFMFERGAFSGATAEQAFRVVTDDSVNTLQGIEQGRFIAEIRVAPSQPLEFITVQLTRTGEGLFATEA
jgi:hypothetical protein